MNDRPVACQIRGPTDPQGDRWRAAPDEGSFVPPSPPQRTISHSGASTSFVSDGDSFAPRRELLLSAVTKVAKSTGRNCVSALPQRATVGCDFPHLLAGITFHHRCRSKGLCVRSPARRLARPLASATAGIFRSCRRPLQAFPLDGSAVLNDTPVACQIREPTDPQGDRCPRRVRMRCRRATA